MLANHLLSLFPSLQRSKESDFPKTHLLTSHRCRRSSRRQLERSPNFKCRDRSPNAIYFDQLSRIPSTFVLPTRPPAFATTGSIGHHKNFHLQSTSIV
ncbi:hypothetical protein LZ554_003511 [Drepanopeziza brunnea f. sp. 'monogermtubi']|nr:hypothetical protein LZ554_003511 [Drepanopeziza brunnea f. sp. 'monogermtubi']